MLDLGGQLVLESLVVSSLVTISRSSIGVLSIILQGLVLLVTIVGGIVAFGIPSVSGALQISISVDLARALQSRKSRRQIVRLLASLRLSVVASLAIGVIAPNLLVGDVLVHLVEVVKQLVTWHQ